MRSALQRGARLVCSELASLFAAFSLETGYGAGFDVTD